MQFSELPRSGHSLVDLRAIVADDIPAWFDYLRDPAVCEHTSWNVESAEECLAHVWSESTREPASPTRFALALRDSDRLVGTAGFHSVSPRHRAAELAYDLAPAYWGRGLATYACGVLTAWAHRSCGVLRIQAAVLRSNGRSARVLERCGYEREGLLRSYRMVRGTPGDFVLYSHLATMER